MMHFVKDYHLFKFTLLITDQSSVINQERHIYLQYILFINRLFKQC